MMTMLEFSNRTTFWLIAAMCVLFAISADAQGQCSCQCSLALHGRLNVCGLLRHLSPKIDYNRKEIDHLKEETHELLEFKESVERRMNEGSVFERLTDKQDQENLPSSDTETERENLDYNALMQEISKLKKKFEDEQTELRAKIANAESYFMRETEKLLASVNNVETRSKNIQDQLVQRIDKVEERWSPRGNTEMLDRVNKDGNQTLKMRNELLGKILENENRLSNFRSEILGKIDEVEDKTSKDKSELLLRIYETANRNLEVKDKVNEVEKNSLQERNKISAEVREMKNTLTKNLEKEQTDRSYLEGTISRTENMMQTVMSAQEQTLKKEDFNKIAENLTQYIYFVYLGSLYDKVDALEKEKYLELDSRIEGLETRMQNVSYLREGFLDHDEHIQTLYSIFNAFKQNLEPTVEELEKKAVRVEGILEKMPKNGVPPDVLTNIENANGNQQQLDEIKNSIKQLQSGITSSEPGLDSSLIHKSVEGLEKCGNIQLTAGRSISKNTCSTVDGKRKGIPSQMLMVMKQKRHGEEFEDKCFTVVVSNYWVVMPWRCIDTNQASYELVIENSRNLSLPFEVENIEGWLTIHDVAYIRSDMNFNYDGRMDYYPACLPAEKIRDKNLETATFLAWGHMENSNLFSDLLQTEVCVITDEECNDMYRPLKKIGHLLMCTQFNPEARRSCMGGGGGILLKEIENKVVLIGITSDCGEPGKPIVYHEMSYLTSYVDEAMKSHGNGK